MRHAVVQLETNIVQKKIRKLQIDSDLGPRVLLYENNVKRSCRRRLRRNSQIDEDNQCMPGVNILDGQHY